MISLASRVWTLLFDYLSSVIFRQPTEPPPKFSIFRGWLGRILKYFRLWLKSYFSWLDWQLFEILWAWSYLKYSLRECTVKPFEVIRGDRRECLDTQSRPPQCSELVLVYCWTRGKQSSACANVLLNWLQKRRLNASLVNAEVIFFRDTVLIRSGNPSLTLLKRRDLWRDAVFKVKMQLSFCWLNAVLTLLKRRDLWRDALFEVKTQLSFCWLNTVLILLKRRDLLRDAVLLNARPAFWVHCHVSSGVEGTSSI